MPVGKVALIGLGNFFTKTLPELLREMDVDSVIYDCRIDFGDTAAFDEYDLLIIDTTLAEGREQEFFGFLIASKGFLIAGARPEEPGEGSDFSSSINLEMSPEEITAKVNTILYRNSGMRKSPRLAVNFPVDYEYETCIFKSSMKNISLNGAFIATLNPPPKNAVIKISFCIPDGGDNIRTSGRVLYTIGYNLDRRIISHPNSGNRKIMAYPGFGILFEGLSEYLREQLRAYIETNEY